MNIGYKKQNSKPFAKFVNVYNIILSLKKYGFGNIQLIDFIFMKLTKKFAKHINDTCFINIIKQLEYISNDNKQIYE